MNDARIKRVCRSFSFNGTPETGVQMGHETFMPVSWAEKELTMGRLSLRVILRMAGSADEIREGTRTEATVTLILL